MKAYNLADLANSIGKFNINEQSIPLDEISVAANDPALLRGYSVSKYEEKFRELMGRLGFSKTLPIKKQGTTFLVAFENSPKARDFTITLENLLKRGINAGKRLTKLVIIDPENPSTTQDIPKGFPAATRAVVVVDMNALLPESYEEHGFVTEDFYEDDITEAKAANNRKKVVDRIKKNNKPRLVKTIIATTNGKGWWNDVIRKVRITQIEIESIVDDNGDEIDFHDKTRTPAAMIIRVYFNPKDWNTEKHGLIYRDKNWLAEFGKGLLKVGLPSKGLAYTEQGMQGDDYVSLECNKPKTIAAFIKAFS